MAESSTDQIRVLQILGNLDVGGAQEVVRTLVQHLSNANCVPFVCTLRDGPVRREIEAAGIEVTVLPPRRHSILALPFFCAETLRIWRALIDLVNSRRVNVVQTHVLGSLTFLVPLLRFTTCVRVVVWTFQNERFELTPAKLPRHKWLLGAKKRAHRRLYRITGRWTSGQIAVSDQVKGRVMEIVGSEPEKITVIYNAVDTSRYQAPVDSSRVRRRLGLRASHRLIATTATLKEQKGHSYLIEAMSHVVPQKPDVHALIIGDGALRETLEMQASALHLGEHIHFLGERQDVPELLAASDLFVLPSLYEGLSVALLEAMATGLPVVASAVSGTVRVIIPGESGILVPPGDSQALATAIGRLLDDPALRATFGTAAQKQVEQRFGAKRQATDHIALYQHLLEASA
jgi:glycosyltransferase involved in cell wall biosynthesis